MDSARWRPRLLGAELPCSSNTPGTFSAASAELPSLTRFLKRQRVLSFWAPSCPSDPTLGHCGGHVKLIVIIWRFCHKNGGWDRSPGPSCPRLGAELPCGSIHEVLGFGRRAAVGALSALGADLPSSITVQRPTQVLGWTPSRLRHRVCTRIRAPSPRLSAELPLAAHPSGPRSGTELPSFAHRPWLGPRLSAELRCGQVLG
jgi:hypothetical protein